MCSVQGAGCNLSLCVSMSIAQYIAYEEVMCAYFGRYMHFGHFSHPTRLCVIASVYLCVCMLYFGGLFFRHSNCRYLDYSFLFSLIVPSSMFELNTHTYIDSMQHGWVKECYYSTSCKCAPYKCSCCLLLPLLIMFVCRFELCMIFFSLYSFSFVAVVAVVSDFPVRAVHLTRISYHTISKWETKWNEWEIERKIFGTYFKIDPIAWMRHYY